LGASRKLAFFVFFCCTGLWWAVLSSPSQLALGNISYRSTSPLEASYTIPTDIRVYGKTVTFIFTSVLYVWQADDDIDWAIMKPHIFAAIMDFFATDQPVINKEVESAVSDTDSGLYQSFFIANLHHL